MASTDEWRTPPAFFRQQWERFHFNVDAAATDANALVRGSGLCYCDDGEFHEWYTPEESYFVGRYYTKETNGLDPSHYQAGDRVWCNPPYSKGQSAAWVKMFAELRLQGVLSVLLLPPSTDAEWFHRYVWDERLGRPREGVELHLPKGRLHFIDPTDAGRTAPRTGNLWIVFHPETVKGESNV